MLMFSPLASTFSYPTLSEHYTFQFPVASQLSDRAPALSHIKPVVASRVVTSGPSSHHNSRHKSVSLAQCWTSGTVLALYPLPIKWCPFWDRGPSQERVNDRVARNWRRTRSSVTPRLVARADRQGRMGHITRNGSNRQLKQFLE